MQVLITYIKPIRKMEKIKVKKEIWWAQSDEPFVWKNIKHVQFEDDDIINIQYVEPYHSENESNDGCYVYQVSRMVEESDKELEARLEKREKILQNIKERNYQTYLKLKEEFE